MRKLFLIIGSCLGLIAVTAESAQTAAQGAEAIVRQATDSLYREIEHECRPGSLPTRKLLTMVDEILLPHADFERMTRWVMGKHWKQASAAQRQRFGHEFRLLLVRTYAAAVRAVSLENIHYLPSRDNPKPNRTVVRTEVREPGEAAYPIHYFMHHKKGRWLVYDIRIEGISLVTSYRSSFADQIRAHGIEGFITWLQQQNRGHTVTAVDGSRSAAVITC